MAEIRDVNLLGVRLLFPDGSSLELDHPPKVDLLWVRPFDVAEPGAGNVRAQRLDLGRFLRARSLGGLVRSLVQATRGWRWTDCRRVCRELASRFIDCGPSRVEALFGLSGLDEKSVFDRLVDAFDRERFIDLAAIPPSATPEQIRRYTEHNMKSLARRWSRPDEDEQDVLDRLYFLTDPAVQALSDEERAAQLQRRSGLPTRLAHRYAHAVAPPDGPLAVFAYLWWSSHWHKEQDARHGSLSSDNWRSTVWGSFLAERVLPNYPAYRALEFRLRRGLRALGTKSREYAEHLAVVALLEAVSDTSGLANYLQAFVAGPHWHGGPRERTWSARLRKHQRQGVKESVELPSTHRHAAASDQVENLAAVSEEEPPGPSGLDLSRLTPVERQAVDELQVAMAEGYGRHSKRGKSLKDWWGPRYAARIRALSRARAKLTRR